MLFLFGSVINNACQNILQWLIITLCVIFSDTLHLLYLNIELDRGKNIIILRICKMKETSLVDKMLILFWG